MLFAITGDNLQLQELEEAKAHGLLCKKGFNQSSIKAPQHAHV
jgi:hypothetical protein